MGVVGLDRGVHDRAPAGDRGLAGEGREGPDHPLQPVDGVGGAVLGAGQAVGDPRHRVVVRLERELLLRAEVVVDPALLEPGRTDEIPHRGAHVALAVEHGRGELDDAPAGLRTLGACHLGAPCSEENRPVGLILAHGAVGSTDTGPGTVEPVCGRYVTVSSPALLAERFHVTDVRLRELEPSYNVAPRADVPVVAERHGERVLDVLRWGLVPFWAKDPKIGDRMINARAETLLTSNAFKRAFERRRCIVPADGFYEWQKVEGKRPKVPWFIRRRDGEPLAFVGLWDTWHDRAAGDDAPRLRTCVIITTQPNELLAPIHDRMPVVLPESDWDSWLSVDNHDTATLTNLLVPLPANELEAWTVSTLVNKADNNSPELLDRVPVASG